MNVELILLPENEGPLSLAFRPPQLAAKRLEAKLLQNGSPDEFQLEVRVPTSGWNVTSPEIALKDRMQIETLIRTKLLAEDRFPEVLFLGTVRKKGGTAQVAGNLSIRGVTRNLKFLLSAGSGDPDHWEGEFEVLQTDFGIVPIRAFGGALRSANRIRARVSVNQSETDNPR